MTLNGIDISAYQSGLDPAAVPGDFVIVKVTGGDGYVNPNARAQIAAARAAGKLVGIYHFARDGYTGATASSEVEWFLHNAADLCDGSTLVVLDWEGDNETDVPYAKYMLDTIHARTGVKPVIYMSFKTIQAADWTPVANADYGLWEAAYVLGYQRIDGYTPPSGLADIPYWSTRMMWQYTSTGYLPGWGDKLDLDLFYGDHSTWAAYSAKNGITTQSGTTTTIGQALADITDLVDRLYGDGTPDGAKTSVQVEAQYAKANKDEILARNHNTDTVARLDATGAPDGAQTSVQTEAQYAKANKDEILAAIADLKATIAAGVKVTATTDNAAIAAAVVAELGAKLKG